MALRTLVLTLALALVATVTFASAADEDAGAAAEREMVMDPSTGKMVTAPQYGGQIVFATASEPPHLDAWWGSLHFRPVNLVLEKLGMVDWANTQGRMGPWPRVVKLRNARPDHHHLSHPPGCELARQGTDERAGANR